jgi:pimeloyl-[acyl-carrier protein] methyl ester esterase
VSARPTLCFVGGWGTTEELWQDVLDRLQSHLSRKGGEGGAPAPKSTTPLKPNEGVHPSKPNTGLPVAPGLNGPPTHFFGWLQCIEDWPGVLARLATVPEPFVLVGWSLGSVLALRAAVESAAEVRRKVAAIALISATPCMCARADALGQHGGVEPRLVAAMRARMNRSPEAVLEDFAVQCAAPDGAESTRLSWLRQARQFSSREMIAGLDALATLDIRERLGEVAAACRILHGECDRIVPLRSAQFLAERIAGAELQVMAGRGHALPFTAAAGVAEWIASLSQ